MERQLLSVLFYGAMVLITATCGAEWLRLVSDPTWAGVYGSWFGGAGSFVAAATAIYIAYWQREKSQADQTKTLKEKRIILAYRLHNYMTNIIQSFSFVNDNTFSAASLSSSFNEDRRSISKRLIGTVRVEQLNIETEIPLITPLSLNILSVYRDMTDYSWQLDAIEKCRKEELVDQIEGAVRFARHIRIQCLSITQDCLLILEGKL